MSRTRTPDGLGRARKPKERVRHPLALDWPVAARLKRTMSLTSWPINPRALKAETPSGRTIRSLRSSVQSYTRRWGVEVNFGGLALTCKGGKQTISVGQGGDLTDGPRNRKKVSPRKRRLEA
jgi:hypothetical protein